MNRVVQKKASFTLDVFETEKKGFGLKTLEHIPFGSYIGTYIGHILDRDEAKRRASLLKETDSNFILSLMEYSGDSLVYTTYIDAAQGGNDTRFINHSCEPNLNLVPVRLDSVTPSLAFFASRDISADEELTFDYGPRIEEKKLCRLQACYCGAVSCRGFLPYDKTLYNL